MTTAGAYLHPKWRDMSEWVVHFTDSEDNLRSILTERHIRPSGPFGQGKNIAETREAHMSACFSEIPLDHLVRLCERHGRWGIGFSKEFMADRGGCRVVRRNELRGRSDDLRRHR